MLETPIAKQDVKSATKRVLQSMPDPFVFVPITQQEAAKGRCPSKRIVRAHVTRRTHLARTSGLSGHEIQDWTVKPYLHRNAVVVPRKPGNGALQERRNTNPPANPNDESLEDAQALLKVLSVPILPVGNAGEDPFWTFPMDHEQVFPEIISHYIQNVMVDIPDLEIPSQKGILRKCWFPLAMTEPATMYAVMLMAASAYCTLYPSRAALINLLALKARALTEINMALATPKKATSDALIGAVAKIAAYEAVFGETDTFAAHMKGLLTMVKLRGGLATLGLNGLLERIVVWIDYNAAHLTGLARTLGGEAFPTVVSLEAPDLVHFAGKEE